MAFQDAVPPRQVTATKEQNPATSEEEVLIRSVAQTDTGGLNLPGLPAGASWQETRLWLALDDAAALRDKLTTLLGG